MAADPILAIGERTEFVTGDGGGVEVAQVGFRDCGVLAKLWSLPLQADVPVTVFGKTYATPRHIGVFGEPYDYSNINLVNQPLTPELAAVLDAVNVQLDTGFNSILVNLYLDGSHSIGAHSDDEPSIDLSDGVVSIAFGQPRTLRFRKKGRDADGKLWKFKDFTPLTEDPHLVWMWGNFQDTHTHEIPKTAKRVGARMSLTFRKARRVN